MTRLKHRILKCLNSNIDFSEQELDIQLRHNIINLTVALAVFGLIFGITNNFFKNDYTGILVDIVGILVLLITITVLRFKIEHFGLITSILTIEFIILFDMLIVISQPADLKHIWF